MSKHVARFRSAAVTAASVTADAHCIWYS